MSISCHESLTPRSLIGSSLALSLALIAGTPLSAQDTVVEGKAQRSDVIEVSVPYNDLDLRNRQNQLLLISRVRKAAGRICDIIYRGSSSFEKWTSRCPQKTYLDAKPQIDFAVANAQNGTRVALNLVVTRSR